MIKSRDNAVMDRKIHDIYSIVWFSIIFNDE